MKAKFLLQFAVCLIHRFHEYIFGIVFTIIDLPFGAHTDGLECVRHSIKFDELIPFTRTFRKWRALEFGIGMMKNRLANRTHLLRFCGTFYFLFFHRSRVIIIVVGFSIVVTLLC